MFVVVPAAWRDPRLSDKERLGCGEPATPRLNFDNPGVRE